MTSYRGKETCSLTDAAYHPTHVFLALGSSVVTFTFTVAAAVCGEGEHLLFSGFELQCLLPLHPAVLSPDFGFDS